MDALRRELASCLGQESDIITSSTAVPPTAAALDCTLLLRNVTLPSAALLDSNLCEHLPSGDDEGNLLADVLIAKGKINRIAAPGAANAIEASTVPVRTVDLSEDVVAMFLRSACTSNEGARLSPLPKPYRKHHRRHGM